MNKLLRELPDDRRHCIGRGEVVYRLSEGGEDAGYPQLLVEDVLDDVSVEAKHTELVGAHNP